MHSFFNPQRTLLTGFALVILIGGLIGSLACLDLFLQEAAIVQGFNYFLIFRQGGITQIVVPNQ